MASNETRYRTAGGAVLSLKTLPARGRIPQAEWACGGCGTQCTPTAEGSARAWANKHANTCRVMPN